MDVCKYNPFHKQPVAILRIIVIAILAILMFPTLGIFSTEVYAQFSFFNGGRLSSKNGKWLTPVDGNTLSSSENDHLARNSVYAWDISVPFGTPAYPMAPGKVIYAGCNNAGGYGCWVFVDHGNNYVSLYAHLIDEGGGTVWVNTGDELNAWTPIGRVGWTGMTSFGPHIHWEIHNRVEGRERIEKHFNIGGMKYCKFCAPLENVTGGLGEIFEAQRPPSYQSLLYRVDLWLLVIVVLLAISALFRPDMALKTTQRTGVLLLRGMWVSKQRVDQLSDAYLWRWARVVFSLFLPIALCSSLLAVQVWMVQTGVSYRELFSFVQFGSFPSYGIGYVSGDKYSAVWGIPCESVGTLGRVCTVDDVIAEGVAWRSEVQFSTENESTVVLIPRINRRFGYNQFRHLLLDAHAIGGLVIIDVENDLDEAKIAIDRLTRFGLDGVALDLEFFEEIHPEDIRQVAEHFALRRKEEGLVGEGILLLWDVFHNLEQGTGLSVEGIKIVPVFTGYGSAVSKGSGLLATQRLFDASAADSGMMAFDKRWPINKKCNTFGTESGFDCQDWQTLFSDPAIQSVGWWVQQ